MSLDGPGNYITFIIKLAEDDGEQVADIDDYCSNISGSLYPC